MGINDEKLNAESQNTRDNVERAVSNRSAKWISGISGGVASALVTVLFLVIPIINTWLANAKEVSLAQIKNTAEQVAYITKRMEDSDKERDLYKREMLECQKELRELKK